MITASKTGSKHREKYPWNCRLSAAIWNLESPVEHKIVL